VSAAFDRKTAAHRIPTYFMPGEEAHERQLGYTCQVLVDRFQASVLELVKSHVVRDISMHRKTGMNSFSRSAHRKDSLDKWAAMSKPLSYGAFVVLTQALGSSDEDVAKGIPFNEQKSITIKDFSRLIYSMGQLAGKMALGPPVIKDDGFHHTVRAAVTYFAVRAAHMGDAPRKEAFSRHMSLATSNKSINFCPWSDGFFPVTGSTSGRKVDRKVVATSWVTLGAPLVARMNLRESDLTPQEVIGLKLHSVQRRIMRDDRRADWNLTDISNLSSVSNLVERQTLPSDWGLNLCSLHPDPDNLVTRTYSAMNRLMDLSQPHIACIFWTSIIFMRAIPEIGHGPTVSLPRPGLRAGEFTEFYKRNVPWIVFGGKATTRLPYVVMFTLSFMAWLEESSPLHSQGVDLKPWHSKHREAFFCIASVFSDLLPGAKCLTPLNFIRCGLADAITTEEGSQLHKGAKYGVNWKPKSKEELSHRATVITQAFKETAAKDGIYEILADIFGLHSAKKLCQKDGCHYPPGLTDGNNKPSRNPATHDGRAAVLPPLLNTSRPAPHRLQHMPSQGQFIMTPRRGIRAMEPNFTPRRLGQPVPLQDRFQTMTPGSIRAMEQRFPAQGPGSVQPSRLASGSVRSQPDSVVTTNTGRMRTSPQRFTAPLKDRFQTMTPGSILPMEQNIPGQGPRFAQPSRLAGGSVRSQPDSVVSANTGRMSTSPQRFTAAEKGKRKESPTPLENDRSHRARRHI